MVFVACGRGWASEQKVQLMKDCPKNNKELCKCGASIIMAEFTGDKYGKLRLIEEPRRKNKEEMALLDRALNFKTRLKTERGE